MLPSSQLSKNQIDRLGARLRKGDISDDDLRLLDSYRRSFSEGYEDVVSRIRDELGLEPTGRPAKSTTSIIEKLRRESVRLSQMQDIAGCRLTAADIVEQNDIASRLGSVFEKVTIVDRREHPSHGYRAVHVIVGFRGKLIEIQIRTSFQHLWAELSEKFSDMVNPGIKYGSGDNEIVTSLARTSCLITLVETLEKQLVDDRLLGEVEEELSKAKQLLLELLEETRENIPEARRD